MHHAVVSRALRQAHKWQLIRQNPAALVDPPKPRPAEVTPLTAAQACTLLAAAREADDRFEPLYTLLLSTGMRISEALALHWGDVNLDTATLRVARSLYFEKGGGARYGSPKGGKGRSIKLGELALAALRRHRLRQAEERLAMGSAWTDAGLIFTTAIGTPLRRDDVYRRHFQPLLKRAGLPAVMLHTLRHTAATLLLSQGTHPTLVQHHLGHSTVAMTLDKYSQWMPSMGDQTATALDRALGPA